jgi:hypothetical protein
MRICPRLHCRKIGAYSKTQIRHQELMQLFRKQKVGDNDSLMKVQLPYPALLYKPPALCDKVFSHFLGFLKSFWLTKNLSSSWTILLSSKTAKSCTICLIKLHHHEFRMQDSRALRTLILFYIETISSMCERFALVLGLVD